MIAPVRAVLQAIGAALLTTLSAQAPGTEPLRDSSAGARTAVSPASLQPADGAALQKGPIALPVNTSPAALPMQTWGGVLVPVIIVSIGTNRLERAVVATGLNANVVSPAAAQRFKLVSVAERVRIDALDVNTVAGQAEIKQFRAATLELPSFEVAIADVPGMISLNPQPEAPPVWLGTPFLSAFQVTLDPASRTVTLTKPSTKIPRPRDTVVVPLKLKDNRPYVRVTIGGSSFMALLDTGSPGTLIPTEVAEKLKLKPLKTDAISRPGGKSGKGAVVVLPRLNVGKAEWKSARVVYVTSDSAKDYDRSFAVIGMDFVGRFKATIDYAHSILLLSPPAAAQPAAQP